MRTFVVHYKKLLDRRAFMLKQLNENQIEFEFVDWYDRDTLTKKEASIFKWAWLFWPFMSAQKRASFAITLSHIYCWKTVADRHEYGLILEDDAVLEKNFKSTLESYIRQLPAEWDMLFLSDACGFHIPSVDIQPGLNVYRKSLEPTKWGGLGGTRAADAYLISQSCAQKILNYTRTRKIDQQVDWWLNGVMRDCALNVYWAEPTIASQGSQNGLYKTSWK